MKRQTIKHLPEEVIGEILSNLAVKSLLRFKSVSKPWRSLISSPKFVQDHLNRSSAGQMLVGTFYSKQIGLTLRSCSLNSLLDEPNQNDVVSTWFHHCPTTGDTDLSSIKFVGSCNGLILLKFNKYSLFLWNPSTGKLKTIPPPLSSDQLELTEPWHFFIYGFGYDDSTDDYKVVCITYTKTHETKIYSLKTDSWKKIDNFGEHIVADNQCKFVNGKLHWLGFEEGVWSIISLSLEEKYQVVALPESFSCDGLPAPHMENLGGYLSIICYSKEANRMKEMHVWVMMKYGVAESWTEIWRFSDFDPPTRTLVGYCTPFWVTKDGDIFVLFTKWASDRGDCNDVVTQSEVVVVYNGNNKLREYRIGRDELQENLMLRPYTTWERKPIVYVGSLVSP